MHPSFYRPSKEVRPPGFFEPELAEHSGSKEMRRGVLGRESGSSVAEDPYSLGKQERVME